MFFMAPIQEEDKPKSAFPWEGTQSTFTCLAQGYEHPPTIAHNALAELQQIKTQEGVQVYQYIDVLVGGEEESAVRTTAQDIWNRLNGEGIEVPPAKSQSPSKEAEFLGAWGVAGQAVIPDETITKLDAISTPTTEKEPQKILRDTGEIIFLDLL